MTLYYKFQLLPCPFCGHEFADPRVYLDENLDFLNSPSSVVYADDLLGSITYAVIISTYLLYQIWKEKAAHAKCGGDLKC